MLIPRRQGFGDLCQGVELVERAERDFTKERHGSVLLKRRRGKK
jgi:hypothetical protein